MRKIEIVVLLIIAVLVVFGNVALMKVVKAKDDSSQTVGLEGESEDGSTISSLAGGILDDLIPTPDSLNVLMIGLDKSKYLADINIVVHLDTTNNKVQLVSLPRDMYIDFKSDQFKDIKAANSKISINYCKLTEVYSNAGGKEKGMETMKAVASAITGLEIDQVVSVDTGGFVEIVDLLGGVEFDVPQRMYYVDPYQDLYIDLQPGLQFLDGDHAEQLVRFRKYKGELPPDIQRMKVQQDFLQALSKKVLAVNSLPQVINLLQKSYEIIKTDMGILTMIEYTEYVVGEGVGDLLASKDMIIVPTTSERLGAQNLWYEKWDPQEVKTMVDTLIGE